MTGKIRLLIAAFVLALPLSLAVAQHDAPAEVEHTAKAAADHAHAAATDAHAAAAHAAGHAEDAHDSHAQPGLLEPDLGTAVWTIVLFVLILVILRFAAWKPILGGLQSREDKQRHDLETAEKAAKNATAKLAEYEAKLATAQAEALKIIDQGRADAQRVAAQLREQSQAEITALKTRAEADIRSAKEQALSEIYTTTATLATDVAGKILGRQINETDQERLVHESLAQMNKN